MHLILALSNTLIFALLGGIHLYWMAGGKRGLVQALPSRENGEQVLKRSSIACLVVGLALFGFAIYSFSLGIGILLSLPLGSERRGIWALTTIFLLRAIGDFKFVGFFKKVKNTEFGKMDTKWYVPLCLYLGFSSAWIGWAITNHSG